MILCCTPYNGQADEDLEVGGLLLVNTVSRQGHDFAHHFSQYWRDIPNTQGFNVQIREIIVPSAGTRLQVKLSHKLVYQTFLGRRQSPISEKVEQAVLTTVNAINLFNQDLDNPDMAGDEW
jgi:curli production assembly/transport component CsgE